MLTLPFNLSVTVPVNAEPFEQAITFDQAGLVLVWNFVTRAGVQTQTVVTPTDTGGAYDWTAVGNGIYKIELPASGGASANNDTVGYGWFSGRVEDTLYWSGPVIYFAPFIAGTADSGTETTLVDSALTQVDADFWKDAICVITSGSIAGQAKYVESFDQTNDTLHFESAFTAAVGTNTYELWPGAAARLAGITHTDAVVPTVAALGAGAIPVGAFADNSITAAALAADAGAEIATAVRDKALAGAAAGTLGKAITDIEAAIGGSIMISGSVDDVSPTATDFDGDSSLSSADDFYNNAWMVFTSGVNAGLWRKIIDYTGASRNFNFAGGVWPAAPANTDTFKIGGRAE